MPLARIRTHFPEEISELCEALIDAGYVVETIRPDEFRIAPADLELSVDKLPVVDAWRHMPDVDTVYVAPGTPASMDIRSDVGARISHEPLIARCLVNLGELYMGGLHWTVRQARTLRGHWQDARQRWTPPHEYHAPIHLEPAAPSNVDHSHELHPEAAIELALRKREDFRRREEAERRALAELARVSEERRTRAREAAQAKALFEEQQKIEAMVRATETLRERVVQQQKPAPRTAPRRRPRRLLKTQRERAFARAGIAALALSMGLTVLVGQALHPRAASTSLPESMATTHAVPFEKETAVTPTAIVPSSVVEPPPTVAPSFAEAPTTGQETTTASLKPAAGRSAHHDGVIADDEVEVIVHRPAASHARNAKTKPKVAHYSDLD